MEKPAEDPPTPAAAPAGDAYVRPPHPKQKKKVKLDDLKREAEMVSEIFGHSSLC